jgi:pimeloyl-ACP methyl ester carboxylesterase
VRRLYPRLAPEIARRLADRLRPQADVLSRPYPQVRPPRSPSSFVYTADDELFRPEWARWAARSLLGVEPIELPGGHFPMAERPLELADMLCDLAGAASL